MNKSKRRDGYTTIHQPLVPLSCLVSIFFLEIYVLFFMDSRSIYIVVQGFISEGTADFPSSLTPCVHLLSMLFGMSGEKARKSGIAPYFPSR